MTNNTKNDINIPKLLWMWAIVVMLISIGMSLYAFLCPSSNGSVSFILTLIASGIGVPLLLLILPNISKGELNLFGLGLKWLKRDIIAVQQRLLANQSVTIVDITGQKWFWIDEFGKAHPVPDSETALFLSKGKGIIHVRADELDIGADIYPSVKDAQAKHNHKRDIFIFYNNTLYYQSSMGFLFWLADRQSVNFLDKESFDEWKDKDKNPWMQQISSDDLKKYKII